MLNYILIINIISAVATVAAIKGSREVVKGNYDFANKLFIAGNSLNIATAISIGNVPLLVGQYMLRFYTIKMLNNKKYTSYTGIGLLIILGILGINTDSLTLDMSAWEFLGTLGAIAGTKRMLKYDFKNMSYWWIVADLIFLYIGLKHSLIGLTIASFMFTLHGCQRLRKEDRSKFNTMDKILNYKLFKAE